MPQAFHILLGAALTVAASFALGRILLRALALKFCRAEERIFSFVTGAACLSLLVFVLATIGLARKGVFQPLGLALAAFALLRRSPAAACAGELPVFWKRLFGVVLTVFGALYFINAMAPEMSPDGSAYHLGLVGRYLRAHGFEPVTTNMYAHLSQGVEMLYLFAYSIGRHSAAALVHFAFLITLPFAMLAYARRFGFPVAGAAGALFAFASPVVGQDGTTAYNDVAVACVLFVLFYLLEIWDRERDPRLLVPAGLLAGFCYAAKYTAAAGAVYAVAFVAWKLIRARRPLLKPLAVLCLCALLMVVPWVAKNWIWLGNPVSPFFNAAFPNPYVHVSFEKDYSGYMQNYVGLKSHREIPLEVTVRGGVLCGLLGPLFLLSPVALLALRRPEGQRLLLAGAVFALPYYFNIGTRFLIPAVPFVSIAMGLALARWQWLAAGLVAAHAVASWPAVLARYCDENAWRLARIPLKQALRIEPEESWLGRRMANYPVARLIESGTPPGARVFSFTGAPDAYTTRELLVSFQAAFNTLLSDMLHVPLIEDFQPRWGLTFRFPQTQLRAIRVVQTASGGPDLWSVTELRVYDGARELPRAPRWRLRANPNPWDVRLAFDNSPVTRWRSWQELFPGMFLQVDFGRAEKIDRVALECSRDQYKVRVRLEGQLPSGEWKPLAAAPEEAGLTPPLEMRRPAIEELKRYGIGYLLIFDDDYGAADFRKNAMVWRITMLGERNGARLYRVD